MIFIKEKLTDNWGYAGEVRGSEPCEGLRGCERFSSNFGSWIWVCTPTDPYMQVVCPD